MGYSLKKLLAQGLQVCGEVPPETKKPPRRQPGTMNKLEAEYSNHLATLLLAGEIRNWWFEGVAFRIGNRCFWHPDFLIETKDGRYELHDTKGHVRDDALVKAKAVAAKFGIPVFHVKKVKKQWSLKRIAA